MKCVARQFSDQKICTRCELMWDLNDDDPPACKTDKQIKRERSEKAHKVTMKELAWLGDTEQRKGESDKQFARRVREGLKDA